MAESTEMAGVIRLSPKKNEAPRNPSDIITQRIREPSGALRLNKNYDEWLRRGAGTLQLTITPRAARVAGAPPEAWLLDVDSCREAAGPGDRRRNLRRFYRSWEKWNRLRGPLLTAADRAAFDAGYGEAA